jgi:hypothetical protein
MKFKSISDEGMKRVAQLVEDSDQCEELKETVKEARNHLYAAMVQSIPSDDQIIMDHVRDAYDLLEVALGGSDLAIDVYERTSS